MKIKNVFVLCLLSLIICFGIISIPAESSYFQVIKGLISNTVAREIRIDSATHTMQTIEYEHHEIHSGSHYFVCGYDPDMDAAEDVDFQVTTPDTAKWAHMTFVIQGTGEVVFSIFENATYDTDGTPVTAYNNDRNSANTSDLIIQTDGTLTTSGTLIYSQAFGYESTPTRIVGGSTERDKEIILKQNTGYRFFIESNTADSIVSYCGEWYEHENKN